MEKYWEGSQEDQHEQGFSLSLSLSLSHSFITFACEEESSLTKKIKQAPDDDQCLHLSMSQVKVPHIVRVLPCTM